MDDLPLAAPTRLNIVSLANLDQQPRNAEFGCGRQIIVVDTDQFSIQQIFCQLEFCSPSPVSAMVLCGALLHGSNPDVQHRNIVDNKYNSAILVNPFYPHAAELMNWVKDNEETLSTYTQSSSAETTSSPLLVSLHDEAIPIANIQSQPVICM
ncbi:hypothetical protein A4A49_26248 [Nicotiana attenuata]|uniref:Uncharacterized protein n=1 Tax=Nicotiana attenuata TaxID=49451 RepID=A0A314L5P6_NICAT|nr:hypothetical protein A4A49_26248 [Nicotiana attenuata]